MSKPIVLFGAGAIAEVAHYHFTKDAGRSVAAFTVDREHIGSDRFCGAPVVPFDALTAEFPPGEFDVFIAMGYTKLNAVRRDKFHAARALGYTIPSYVSSRATVLNDGRIGANCFILEGVTVQPFVQIGDNVTVWNASSICHHSVIEDDVFIASHVVVSGNSHIGEASFIGANATLRDSITVGPRCVIGAGALVLGDTAADGVYIGTATDRSQVPSARLKGI